MNEGQRNNLFAVHFITETRGGGTESHLYERSEIEEEGVLGTIPLDFLKIIRSMKRAETKTWPGDDKTIIIHRIY